MTIVMVTISYFVLIASGCYDLSLKQRDSGPITDDSGVDSSFETVATTGGFDSVSVNGGPKAGDGSTVDNAGATRGGSENNTDTGEKTGGAGGSGGAAGSGENTGVGENAGSSGGSGGAAGGSGISCTCSTNDACCDGCLPKNEGGSCVTDNIDCTDDICRAGKCVHELKRGFCLIDGACYADVRENPANRCQFCDVSVNTGKWRNKISGSSCDDGFYCNGPDTCDDAGDCSNHAGNPCTSSDLCKQCDEISDTCTYLTSMTWYDSTSNLSWQVTPSTYMDWQSAVDYCEGLTLCGRDSWRLPTISELRSLIRGCAATQTGGNCGATDSCYNYSCAAPYTCNGCTEGAGPAAGYYWPAEIKGVREIERGGGEWSSSSFHLTENNTDDAWIVNFGSGIIAYGERTIKEDARCVRTGQ
jgi:hypothetical protein